MSRKRSSAFNPPRGVQVSAGDMVMLERLQESYNQVVDQGEITVEYNTSTENDKVTPDPSWEGFVDFATHPTQVIDFVKSDVAPVISDVVGFTADQIAVVESKVLPSTGTTITSLGVIALMTAIGLVVAAKHL